MIVILDLILPLFYNLITKNPQIKPKVEQSSPVDKSGANGQKWTEHSKR